jgi:hypothetical protein
VDVHRLHRSETDGDLVRFETVPSDDESSSWTRCLACDDPIMVGDHPALDAVRSRLCRGCRFGADALILRLEAHRPSLVIERDPTGEASHD